ncbi:MAG: HlyC/CorC family transporter [Spirochaetaceae bacterium]|nr:MAG: HlyC/CorC family transporter [Spirochaetaceae bacterium]
MTYLILLLCTISAAFFAGLETGLLAADQLTLYLKKEKGIYYARAADYLLLRPERLLGTTLIGTNISVVTAAIVVASALREQGFESVAWIGSLALSVFLLIFTEIIPKTFFRRRADTIAVRLAPILAIFHFLLLPLELVLNGVIKTILLILGRKAVRSKLPQSRDDLRLLVRLGSRESGLGRSEHRVFEDIFDFRTTLAREVMIPLHEYPVCTSTATIPEAVEISYTNSIRFLPVFEGRADNIIGYLDVESLLRLEIISSSKPRIRELMTEAVFYPDVKRIPDLLLEMNRRKIEVVFLSDEYGSVSGLITPAEIASEIVGFVPGEVFQLTEDIEVINSGHYVVAGTTDIEDLYHETGIPLKKRNYDTVGGFICEHLGRIPQVGTIFEHGGYHFQVLDSDDRHIIKLEITRGDADATKKKA